MPESIAPSAGGPSIEPSAMAMASGAPASRLGNMPPIAPRSAEQRPSTQARPGAHSEALRHVSPAGRLLGAAAQPEAPASPSSARVPQEAR